MRERSIIPDSEIYYITKILNAWPRPESVRATIALRNVVRWPIEIIEIRDRLLEQS